MQPFLAVFLNHLGSHHKNSAVPSAWNALFPIFIHFTPFCFVMRHFPAPLFEIAVHSQPPVFFLPFLLYFSPLHLSCSDVIYFYLYICVFCFVFSFWSIFFHQKLNSMRSGIFVCFIYCYIPSTCLNNNWNKLVLHKHLFKRFN